MSRERSRPAIPSVIGLGPQFEPILLAMKETIERLEETTVETPYIDSLDVGLQALVNKSPDEISAYIEDEVTDIAGARDVLKEILTVLTAFRRDI